MHWFERWLLPPKCVVSDQPAVDRDLSPCVVEGWHHPVEVCPQCCELSSGSQVCGACLTQPPAFDRTQAAFYFEDELVELIHGLKYQNQVAYARVLGELLAERVEVGEVEAIVAVPLYATRFRDRGYNQAELIAQSLAKSLNVPLIKQACQRIKNTPSQTDLNAQQRRKNLRKAFAVDPEKLEGLSQIAIIDDVITTGATMHALAQIIKAKTEITTVQAWSVAKTK